MWRGHSGTRQWRSHARPPSQTSSGARPRRPRARAGDLTEKQRNALLAEMTDEVAALVLRDNYDQAQALSTSLAQAASMAEGHER